MTDTARLVPEAARAALRDLQEALGSENKPGQWMQFMQTVTRLLPDVLSEGRPSRAQIERSVIGQLGFTSWRELVESPQGLDWNWSGWKAWRRAWRSVEAHPWLLDTEMSSSEVNRLAQRIRRDGDEWPESPAALDEYQQAQREADKQRAAESLEAIKSELAAAREQAIRSEAEASGLREQVAGLRADLEAARAALVEAQASAQNAERDRAEVERLSALVNEMKSAGLLKRIFKWR